jgi:hypothetical protein
MYGIGEGGEVEVGIVGRFKAAESAFGIVGVGHAVEVICIFSNITLVVNEDQDECEEDDVGG